MLALKNITKHKFLRLLTLLVCTLVGISSCSMFPRNISDTDVEIERLSAPKGYIKSASFWEDSEGISLRGTAASRPVSTRTRLRGHIDITITAPDRSVTVCTTARLQAIGFKKRKPFTLRLETLPEPGSVVRIRHHKGSEHASCMSPRSQRCDS